jgi:hypothetical protein
MLKIDHHGLEGSNFAGLCGDFRAFDRHRYDLFSLFVSPDLFEQVSSGS